MLTDVYVRSPAECDIEIVFAPDAEGLQNNVFRETIEDYASSPTLSTGRVIASALQRVTTHRSGLGLLFLLLGGSSAKTCLTISRFPADQGIVAQEKSSSLSVEFIERVFMKNAKAYKSAFFETRSLDAGFEDGRAVDRQLSGPRELSDYWIKDFLNAELRTTGAAGSKRLAEALRNAVSQSADMHLIEELVAAARLIRGQHGKVRSANGVLKQLGVSDGAVEAIRAAFPRPELMDERFRFDREEFQKHAQYRTVELDNGALLTADSSQFDEVFEQMSVSEGRTRYTTEGEVIDQRFRKTR